MRLLLQIGPMLTQDQGQLGVHTLSLREEQRSAEHYATLSERPLKTVLLHVVPVKIITLNGNCLTTYGLLDNASRGTVISSDIAKKIRAQGTEGNDFL